jgi:hypothetical protein
MAAPVPLATTLTSMPVSFLNSGSSTSSRPDDSVLVVVDILRTLSWAPAIMGNANNITATISPNFLIIPPPVESVT